MAKLKDIFCICKSSHIKVIGAGLIPLLALLLLWHGNATNIQATPALVAQVYFEGEYRIADGPWQPIVEGKHISSTKGDVTLRGNFHMRAPNGEYIGLYTGGLPIALYTDHISLTIYEGNNWPHTLDIENPLYGDSACGVYWSAYTAACEEEAPIEIHIHNPHHFGNETAIDELLANVSFWYGLDFEKGVLEKGEMQRTMGFAFIIIALTLVGIALFSSLIHYKNSRLLWLLGMVVMFAGIYLTYSADGISFWSSSAVSNTTILGGVMILYMLFLSMVVVCFLGVSKKVGMTAVVCLGTADALVFLTPVVTDLFFYDTWPVWIVVQLVSNLVLLGCLVKECFQKNERIKVRYIGSILPLIAFAVDVAMTGLGVWKGGIASQYVFFLLFAVVMVVVLRVIPSKINAAEQAKELELQRGQLEAEKNIMEAELKERRVAIMLSQIRPHFIYNTLGTIERMCLKDPQKANEMVRNFGMYLRGNFSELDSVTPIRFADELKHVQYYANIEKVRFPDMNIEYEIETTEFVLPALSVQPLVENAIKHGLMRLETGGTVVIRSYETPTHFCVEVEDDGVGFDPSLPVDEKKHVGLRNIRGRLKVMVDGELLLQSKPGAGTKAVVLIPKEVTAC